MSKIEEMRVYAINECAKLYGFDASDALGKVSIKKTEKEKKERGVIVPLPFSGMVNEDYCQGIKKNYGLYTQCEKKKTKEGEYCTTCDKQAAKNENGEPNLGNIVKRMEEGWRDAKGRGPVNYRKVMKKLGLTEEQVMEEATRQGVELDEAHFAEEVKRGRPKKEKAVTSDTESEGSSSSKKRGRPKKAVKVVEVDTTEDLFATLVSGARAVTQETVAVEVVEEVKEVVEEVKEVVVSEVQEVNESSSGTESEGEKSEGEKKVKTKKSKEEREAAKAEKEAKKAAKDAEKAAKDAEKAAKAEAKAAKDAEKEAKKAAKTKKVESVKIDEVAVVEEELEEEGEVAVEEFEFEGKKYLKSANNVLYDMETQDEIGVWNDKEKKVEPLQELESESDSE
jgi:chemotaxis protein histidine kinase CheA